MTITLSKATVSGSKEIIATALQCSLGDAPLYRALAADHLRSALYASASIATELTTTPSVHTTRLLTSARKTLDLVQARSTLEVRQTGEAADLAQQTLDSLSSFGDVLDTGGGFWIGAPLRLVGSGEAHIVLGAAPNAVIKSVLGTPPICAGISRLAEHRAPASGEVARLVLSVDEWLGVSQPLQIWATGVMRQHERIMQSGNDIPASQLEIYAPDVIASRRQRGRWLPAEAVSERLVGARLCRPRVSYAREWARPYYLAYLTFNAGELVVSRSAPVEYALTRRLRFGLDALLGANQTIFARSAGEAVELEIPLGLPEPEARVTALGWSHASNPNRTVFHKRVLPLITEVMARLDIAVVEH